MICIVAGTRNYENQFVFDAFLNECITRHQYYNFFKLKDLKIVHGGARGVDYMATQWHKKYSSKYRLGDLKIFEAKWEDFSEPCSIGYRGYDREKYNKLAGFKRNQEMVDYAVSTKEGAFLVALLNKDSMGTKDTVKRATLARITVYRKDVAEWI